MQLGFWQTLRPRLIGAHLYGALVGGIGLRLAMLALRLTSPRGVRGVESDDGFTIGRFTLSGSYNLIVLGAAAGLIALIVFSFVEPFLIGPPWFQRVTLAAGSGAVVGSMLVHADGIDFNLLKPAWFAIALFVALPALFAAFFGDVQRYACSTERWINQPGVRRWLVPIGLVATTLPLLVLLPFVIALSYAAHTSRQVARDVQPRTRGVAIWLGRAVWLAIALLGAQALLSDATAIL